MDHPPDDVFLAEPAATTLSRRDRHRVETLLANATMNLCRLAHLPKEGSPSFAPCVALVTQGSPSLDELLLRHALPYLHRVSTEPYFQLRPVTRPTSLVAADSIYSLDEHALVLMCTYLYESELATLACACALFRVLVVSPNFSRLYLKQTQSHFGAPRSPPPDISLDLPAFLNSLVHLRELLPPPDAIAALDPADAVHRALQDLYADSAHFDRFRALSVALRVRRLLALQRASVAKASRALARTLRSPTLCALVKSAVVLGRALDPQQQHQGNALMLGDLARLPELKSRFHSRFTGIEAVLLSVHSQREQVVDLAADLRACDDVASTLHEARVTLALIDSASALDSTPFDLRIKALLRAQPIAQLREAVRLAQAQAEALALWLSRGSLSDVTLFATLCARRLTAPREESPRELRDIALAATALEARVVGEKAALRAITRADARASAQQEKSAHFVQARARVELSLSVPERVDGGGGGGDVEGDEEARARQPAPAATSETKVWRRTCFDSNDQFWLDVEAVQLDAVTTPEELRQLFSRGPDVSHSNVGNKFRGFRQFSSDDFACSPGLAAVEDLSKTRAKLGVLSWAPSPPPPRSEAGKSAALSPALILSWDRLVELKKSKQLATLGLDPSCLQCYLSDEEFARVFRCTRTAFDALPEWKQKTLKKKADLF